MSNAKVPQNILKMLSKKGISKMQVDVDNLIWQFNDLENENQNLRGCVIFLEGHVSSLFALKS